MSDRNSTWDSGKSLFSAKTIPFLISQGVVPKLFPVGTLLLGIILTFLWAYLIAPTVYTGAGPVNLSDSWKQEYIKQAAWQLQANGNTQAAQDNAKKQLDALGNAGDELNTLIANTSDPQLAPVLQNLKPLAQNNPAEMSKVQPGLLNSNIMPLLCILGTAIIVGGAVIVNPIIPITLLFHRRSTEKSTITQVPLAHHLHPTPT